MHQIRFTTYSAPPDLLAGFKGPISKGKKGRRMEWEERWGTGEGAIGKTGKGERRGKLRPQRIWYWFLPGACDPFKGRTSTIELVHGTGCHTVRLVDAHTIHNSLCE